MKIRSLAFKTDLIFHRFNGVVIERDDHVVVRTPSNPGYHWGNLVYFPEPPSPGAHQAWRAIFEREFADLPVKHVTFGWDSTDGSTGTIAPFLTAGFELEQSVVMVGSGIRKPPAWNSAVEIRTLASEEDWEAAVQNHMACREPVYAEAGYLSFTRKRMADHRRMVAAGKGFWIGALLEGILVGDLGIFAEDGLGRFESVQTNPAMRRLGVCTTLVHAACLLARDRLKADTLVIEAKPESAAGRIYRSLGFEPRETVVGLCRWEHDQT